MERERLRREVEAHHQAAYGWALTCTGRDPERAAEVLQMSYVKIASGSARYDGRASFKTWLFAVVRNTAFDLLRHERLRSAREAGDLDALPAPVDPAPDPQAEALSRERARDVTLAMRALPERQREVLHLVFYEGMSILEASQVMGISLGAARTHYARGKQHLRLALAPKLEVVP